jgi:hypothetical protein
LANRDILAKQYVYRWIDGILELPLDLKRRGLVLAPKAEIKCNK